MKVSIKQADALSELAKIQGISQKELIEKIETALTEERVCYFGPEDCGQTLNQVAQDSGYSVADLFKVIFRHDNPAVETLEFFGGLLIFGDSDCPNCGYELEQDIQGCGGTTWVEKFCPNCKSQFTNEPDWDDRPGGADYDS